MANLSFSRSRPYSAGGGQAMVEMAVALIPIMVVLVAVIQIGLLCHAHSRTMMHARREASTFMFTHDFTHPHTDGYILDWQVGGDGVPYSSDDTPVFGLPSGLIATYAQPSSLDTWVSENPVSRLASSHNLNDNFAFVRGFHQSRAPNLPVSRRLIYNNDSSGIDVKSEAWLVWSGGLY